MRNWISSSTTTSSTGWGRRRPNPPAPFPSRKVDRSRIVAARHAPEKRERARQLRRTMTPAETALWNHLRAGRLDSVHFRRQQIIDGFIADFYCHAAGLVIEVDGDIHAAQID